jgi:hypothetical protein
MYVLKITTTFVLKALAMTAFVLKTFGLMGIVQTLV